MANNAFIDAILRQKSLILGAVAVCVVLSQVQYKFTPKNYKVTTSFTLQPSYFQVPLVRDFMPETFDSNELRYQRESLLHRALNFEYLKAIGTRYTLFGKVPLEEVTTYDLQELSKKFDIIPVGQSNFVLEYQTTNPEQGYNVVLDVMGHLRKFLADERRDQLLKIHAAIQDQLESLAFGRSGGISKLMASRPDLVKQEMERLQDELRVLRTTYSEKHPKVAELQSRIKELSKWLKPGAELSPPPARTESFTGAKVDDATHDLFQDLLRKYHYLQVSMDLDQQGSNNFLTYMQEPFVPKSATWPKRPIYLIWGVAAGFLVGSLLALFSEMSRAKRIKLTQAPEGMPAAPIGLRNAT